MCENEDTDAPHSQHEPPHKVDTKLYKTLTPSQGGSIKPRSSTQRRAPRRARAKESSQRRRQTASTRGGLAGASSVCARETSDDGGAVDQGGSRGGAGCEQQVSSRESTAGTAGRMQ